MRGQQEQRIVIGIDQQVVNEHADGNSALGCAKQTLGGENTDIVSAPDEVLDVDGFDSICGQPRAAYERLLAFLENVSAGLPRHSVETIVATGADALRDRLGTGSTCSQDQQKCGDQPGSGRVKH